jgi:AraC family transcriptional regulator, regulatory protein of adaptative response / methylated-DNA-[protein]-cysteine methyltransferase
MEDYARIAQVIEYLGTHFKEQPDLETVAKQVYLSPFHFQKLFTNWAGVSPKKFLQYLSLQHAKQLLLDQHTLAEASFETGLSGTSRLHDLFVQIEGMTPGEFKNGGRGLTITYCFAETPFGEIIMASTAKGICNLFFVESRKQAESELHRQWPNAVIKLDLTLQEKGLPGFFTGVKPSGQKIKLHLKGTDFQLKVWEALLKIPLGGLRSYGAVSDAILQPGASRAVGTAIAANPVAWLIPCHRVIKSTGLIGEYHWGSTRKKAIIGWEAAQIPENKN